MNRHFEDARYYLHRAGEHAKRGVAEELEPVADRVRSLTGREDESDAEPARLDRLREDLEDAGRRAEDEARAAAATARRRIRRYRGA